MSNTAQKAYDAGPSTTTVPMTLPAATTADSVAVPADWSGVFVRFRANGGTVVIRFSTEAAIGDIDTVSLTASGTVNASGVYAPDAGPGEPHLRLADGESAHLRIDTDWTFFSYQTDASTTLDACMWTGDSN